ncbi:hypothetical protein DPMN_120227 [Dreissena polymorpha]|uniref:Uncharacterized protein n=1 Tax=Dreissena polymorpha TaxID=45954 RepID=A0A9D4GJC8_DREPO|nr:hypothetical protein DPMN_120227 [Dreissena polymorpha]
MLLFKDCICVSHAHYHVCSHLTNSVKQFLLQENVESFKAGEHALPTRSVTKASKARIKYVGGYCVHSVLQKFNTIRRASLYSTSANGQLNYENAEQTIAILNRLTEREEVLKATSKEPDSLLDTEQRQYQSRGLINITDGMYHFFCQVCDMCLQ